MSGTAMPTGGADGQARSWLVKDDGSSSNSKTDGTGASLGCLPPRGRHLDASALLLLLLVLLPILLSFALLAPAGTRTLIRTSPPPSSIALISIAPFSRVAMATVG